MKVEQVLHHLLGRLQMVGLTEYAAIYRNLCQFRHSFHRLFTANTCFEINYVQRREYCRQNLHALSSCTSGTRKYGCRATIAARNFLFVELARRLD